jgi:hypothetical protein
MRRKHWWGATLGAGVIAGAVLLAPSAMASPRPGPGPSSWQHQGWQPPQGRHDFDGPKPGHDFDGPKPGYGRWGRPCVTVRADQDRDGYKVLGWAQTGKIRWNNAKAGVYVLRDGGNWKKVGVTTTDKNGRYEYQLKQKGHFQVMAVVNDRYGKGSGRSSAHEVGGKRHR